MQQGTDCPVQHDLQATLRWSSPAYPASRTARLAFQYLPRGTHLPNSMHCFPRASPLIPWHAEPSEDVCRMRHGKNKWCSSRVPGLQTRLW